MKHGLVDPRPIAAVRIGLGVATVLNAVELFRLLQQIANGKVASPVADWIPAPNSSSVIVYLFLACLAGVSIAVGYRTATAVTASTIISVSVFLWDQQTYSNHLFLATLLVGYLGFARSEAVWSITAPRSGIQNFVPWEPQLLMMTQLSVCYFFSATSKVNSVFLSGKGLETWVWWALPEWLFSPMALATILAELFLAAGLWFQQTRSIAVCVGVGLHLSIILMLRDPLPLIAFSLLCVPLYALFLTRPALIAQPGRVSELRRTTKSAVGDEGD